MADYFNGRVDLPIDGSAVPVCSVGASGILVCTASQGQVYIGGSGVTPANGLPIRTGDVTFVPGHAERPDLYACGAVGSQSEKLAWFSTDPETAASAAEVARRDDLC